jgi:YHS domain-containing protein
MEINLLEKAYCPVMEGVPVDREEAEKLGRVREVSGKKYYLCCDACIADFDANPKQYAD